MLKLTSLPSATVVKMAPNGVSAAAFCNGTKTSAATATPIARTILLTVCARERNTLGVAIPPINRCASPPPDATARHN